MPTSITSSGITFDDATTLTTGVVPTANIANAAVTTAKINDAAITPAKLSGAQSGSAPIYGARAWVNFNGTGTVAIRASGNVSSITDNGTGDYTVNFTTAMPNADYATVVACGMTSNTYSVILGTVSLVAATTTGRRFSVNTASAGTAVDMAEISVSIID